MRTALTQTVALVPTALVWVVVGMIAAGATGQPTACLPDTNGDGHPMFATPAVIAAPCTGASGPAFSCGSAVAFATADLDGDGVLDMAIANSRTGELWGSYVIARGLGDGVFDLPQFVYQEGAQMQDAAAADLDLDGDVDLVLVNRIGNELRILANTGVGKFEPALSVPVGTAPSTVAVADFNQDGRPDLAVHNTTGTGVSLVVNASTPGSGVPVFLPEQRINTPTGSWWVPYEPRSGTYDAAGDVNKDGWPDLVVCTGAGFRVLANDGAWGGGGGTLIPEESYAYPGGSGVSQVVLGDFDGDGWPDAACAALTKGQTGHASLAVWRNIGRPANVGENQFETPVLYDTSTFVTTEYQPVTLFSPSIAAGDFDGDGDIDLATDFYESSWQIVLLMNQGDGAFGEKTIRVGAGNGSTMGMLLKSVDVNNDGMDDLAQVPTSNSSPNSQVTVYLSAPGRPVASAEPNEEWGINYPPGLSYAPFMVTLGNIDGVAGLDAVTMGTFDKGDVDGVMVHRDQQGSYIGPGQNFTHSPTPEKYIYDVLTVDLTGDGVDEVIAGNLDNLNYPTGAGIVLVFGNPGDGELFAKQAIPTPESGIIYRFAAGDLDNDGDNDIAVWCISTFVDNSKPIQRKVIVLENDGTGTLSIHSVLPLAGPNTQVASGGVIVRDLDGDGWADIAATNGHVQFLPPIEPSMVTVWWNDETGDFTQFTSLRIGEHSRGLDAADIDRDGLLDLVICHGFSPLLESYTTPMTVLRQSQARTFKVALLDPDLTSYAVDMVGISGKTGEGHTRVIRQQPRGVTVIDVRPNFTIANRANYTTGSSSVTRGALRRHPDGRTDVVMPDFTAQTINALLDRRCPPVGGCPADCDASGSLDIDDFICFQTKYAVGDPLGGADCDQNGSLDIDDFICFQTAYAVGC